MKRCGFSFYLNVTWLIDYNRNTKCYENFRVCTLLLWAFIFKFCCCCNLKLALSLLACCVPVSVFFFIFHLLLILSLNLFFRFCALILCRLMKMNVWCMRMNYYSLIVAQWQKEGGLHVGLVSTPSERANNEWFHLIERWSNSLDLNIIRNKRLISH